MKGIFRKVLASFIVAAMVISSAPLSGLAGLKIPDWICFSITSNAAEVSGTCGTNATWTYDDETFTLTISGTGNMSDYYTSQRGWYSYKDEIENVVVENGITYLGNFAFYDFANLTNVEISDSVTSMGGTVFGYCDNLSSITLPSGLTNIGDSAFYRCKSLTNITIPESVTSIEDDAFRYCESLTGIIIPDTVTNLGENVCYGCSNLTTAVIGSGVTAIRQYAFNDCSSLTSVSLTGNVTEVGYAAFSDCEKLSTVHFSGTEEQWSSITYEMKHDRYIYNEYFINALILDDNGNELAKTGVCGDNLTWKLYNSTGVLTISGIGDMYDFGTVNSPWMFYLGYIQTVVIEDGVTSVGEDAFSSSPEKLTSVTIADTVTSIGESAFAGADIEEIKLPKNLISIGRDAFSSCHLLKSVVFPEGLTTIGALAFTYCESLETVHIPANVSSIGLGPFSGCISLVQITVDENNKNYTSDEYGVLFTKDKGVVIQYPNGNTRESYMLPETVWGIENSAFAYSTNLKNVKINDGFETIGPYAFEDCVQLTEITIPDTVTTIHGYAFSGCINIKSVDIPEGVTSIEQSVFLDCDSLTSVTIPDGVTNIGRFAFNDCDHLTTITIPSSVTVIDNSAFRYSDNITDVYFKGTETQWKNITIGTYNTSLTDANIHFGLLSINLIKDQIRFGENEAGMFSGIFDYRVVVKLDGIDSLCDSVDDIIDTSDGDGILEVGYIFNKYSAIDLSTALSQIKSNKGKDFAELTGAYTQVNDAYISTSTVADEYTVACVVREIPESDVASTLSMLGYVIYVQNGETMYLTFDVPYTTTFESLYNTYYPLAFPS